MATKSSVQRCAFFDLTTSKTYLDIVQVVKKNGNDKYSHKDYDRAISRYEKALQIIESDYSFAEKEDLEDALFGRLLEKLGVGRKNFPLVAILLANRCPLKSSPRAYSLSFPHRQLGFEYGSYQQSYSLPTSISFDQSGIRVILRIL